MILYFSDPYNSIYKIPYTALKIPLGVLCRLSRQWEAFPSLKKSKDTPGVGIRLRAFEDTRAP